MRPYYCTRNSNIRTFATLFCLRHRADLCQPYITQFIDRAARAFCGYAFLETFDEHNYNVYIELTEAYTFLHV